MLCCARQYIAGVGLSAAVILDGLFADRHRSSTGILKPDPAPVCLLECQIPPSHLYPLFTDLSLRLLCHGDVDAAGSVHGLYLVLTLPACVVWLVQYH